MDGGKEHDSFTHFVGKLPTKPIEQYCVRGNISMTLDEIMDNPNNWIGIVSDIKSKHGKITLYVKEAQPVEPVKEEAASEKQQ